MTTEDQNDSVRAVPKHVVEQANAIAYQAEAIAAGTTTASLTAAAKLVLRNAETLLAWCEQVDGSGP